MKTFTVALSGADGAGKSTISKQLIVSSNLPYPVKSIYMGVNLNASNYMLPTTYLWYAIKRLRGNEVSIGGPPELKQSKPLPKNLLSRGWKEIKSSIRMVNLIAEEWYRQLIAWLFQSQGCLVLFDRHFFLDYYAHHIADSSERTLAERFHGFLLEKVFPKPDIVIHLDAPAELLYARKKEGTLEALEHRRQEYFKFKEILPNFVIVDVAQPIQVVMEEIEGLIWNFARTRKGQRREKVLNFRD